MSAKTTGLRETQENLARMRFDVRGELTRRAVRQAAQVVLGAMRERAPILDEKTAGSSALPPGTLKAKLNVAIRVREGGNIVQAWIGPAKIANQAAHLVEYGHRLVKGGKSRIGPMGAVGPGHEVGEVPEHPFLRPGYEASWAKSLETFTESMKEMLKGWVR